MTTPNERLRKARARFYPSAADAARALGVQYGTYAGHENGHRGFPASRAPEYARRFKVSPEWLLYGKGEEQEVTDDLTDADLSDMVANALRELPAGVPLGDFPRLIAPVLREQLERFRADREPRG
jgi:transcriptional regulator with XRE-family HTH domain